MTPPTTQSSTPDFESVFGLTGPRVPDPLAGMVRTGDLEIDSQNELGEVGMRIRDEMQDWYDQFRSDADPGFYLCAVFQSHDQLDAFLEAIGMEDHIGAQFINGLVLAERLGVVVPLEPVRRKPAPTAPVKLRGTPKITYGK